MVIWRMLSHIRTQKTLRALPCELFESHTNSPCWEKNLVSLFVGSLCWGYTSLGLRVPYSHCCLAISPTHPLTAAPEPLLLGVTFRLFIFFVLSSFSVFSSKFVMMGLTWHRKCSGVLRLVRSNWIWARKESVIHLGQEAAVFMCCCNPLGEWKWNDPCHCPGVKGPLRRVKGNNFYRAPAVQRLIHIAPFKTHMVQHTQVLLLPLFCWCGSRREKTHLQGEDSSSHSILAGGNE